MATAAIFCIGSGHNSKETKNVLTKLWTHCRYSSLGAIGNHTTLFNRTGPHNTKTEDLSDAENGGWTWINEGQNTIGTGAILQAQANLKLLKKLDPKPNLVVMAGHSRGGALCVRIAQYLYQWDNSIGCAMFLLDPVQQDAGSELQIYDNIRWLMVLAAEDVHRGKIFQLMPLTRPAPGGGGGKMPLSQNAFIRIPGMHGSATQTQVNNPVGRVTYYTALRYLDQMGVPMRADKASKSTDKNLIREYSKIKRENPRTRKGIKIVDFVDKPDKQIYQKVGKSRKKDLARIAGDNLYYDSRAFVNRHHHDLLEYQYPELVEVIDGMESEDIATHSEALNFAKTNFRYATQYLQYSMLDPEGHKYLKSNKVLPEPKTF